MKVIANNRKAFYEYEIIDKYTAGIKLVGSEVKSCRDNGATIKGSYCFFDEGELFIKNMNISEFKQGGKYNNHEPTRDRKLLLTKKELNKLFGRTTTKGMTIIPLRLFISDKGYIKLEIALAKGKKQHDKQKLLKEKAINLTEKRENDIF